MHYQLYYWTGLQGRGEFVRLALEDSGAAYTDVARIQGDEAMTAFLQGEQVGAQPFAPPFLKAGDVVVAQVAAILHFIGPQLQLVPDSEPQRLQALQLQLTIADLVAEVHDTHHPIATGLYYEDQQAEAAKRARDLRENRLPKFLGYFEQVLQHAGGTHLLGTHSYVDLSLFQLVSGLEYMFPTRMATLANKLPGLKALHQRVDQRPRIAAYLASERRVAFNTNGIFRHYPELDAA
ncbi:glutathione S-transferase [Xanthomonas axonopodis]|uniref:Glutathione S-transferase n=1 Tax=Xanthomonas axonopodis TaxID=53413 RepID=A0A0P6VQT0_9XANT|nr:glutathione S-transferase [Xanthomonas axonopodis]KPL48471.1 glutathione S-transferase [Xanthomonas axonopodis]